MDKNDFNKLDPIMGDIMGEIIDKFTNSAMNLCLLGVLGHAKSAISCAQDDLANFDDIDTCRKNIHYACDCLLEVNKFLQK